LNSDFSINIDSKAPEQPKKGPKFMNLQ